jgi:hypothetical protein
MADISAIKLPNNDVYNFKDTTARNDIGVVDYLYKEVEWVESTGRQYVYLNWKPPIATWGFSADFISKNAVNTTVGAWNASTNINGYGSIFGVRNSSTINNCQLSSYSNGAFRLGGGNIGSHGFKTDKTRQTMSMIGSTFTKPDGTTMSVTRVNETADKPYCNMAVFACYEGLRRTSNGGVIEPSTTRIYSLKFYESTTVVVDLVGAIRIKDGMTGLYDKIEKHFYPAPGMSYGNIVGNLGDKETLSNIINEKDVQVVANNYPNPRLLSVAAPQLVKLEDGQQISVTFLYNSGNSVQTTELVGWDDTSNNSNVYLKLTLADNSVTEWIPCYYSSTGRLTTHYSSSVPILLTYRENVLTGAADGTGGSIIVRAFYCEQNYDTNTIDRVRESYFRPYTGENLYRYKFVLQGADNRVYPIVITNQTTGTQVAKVPTSVGLRPGRIWWYNTTTVKNAGTLLDANTLDKVYQTTTSVYNFNTNIEAYRMVYLRGTYDKDTDLFTLYNDGNSPCTSYYAQVPTNTANITLSSYLTSGYYYMLLGASYSSTNYVALFAYNPLYYFDGTNLIPASTKITKDSSFWQYNSSTDSIDLVFPN